MTSQENLQNILQSMDPELPEIKHVILKSQINRKQNVTIQKRR